VVAGVCHHFQQERFPSLLDLISMNRNEGIAEHTPESVTLLA
jgi:hypothetical protein